MTESPAGRRMTRVLIRDRDHSASGIAPVAVRDRMADELANRELHPCAPSRAANAVRRRWGTRVPREANARRPKRAKGCNKGRPTHAECMVGPLRTILAKAEPQPLPGSVDEATTTPRKLSVNGAVFSTAIQPALPIADSYLLTNTTMPCGHRSSGD